MGVHVHGGTIPGGVTPICNSCGTSLCWDISKGEYQEDKVFWDGWVCQECNGGRPMRRADFRGLRAATTEHQDGSRFYTGVGSRDTPEEVLSVMRTLAKCLARAGYTLRSGGAEGADAAFESGAQEVPQAKMQIYLPWRGFNGNGSPLYTVDRNAMAIARSLHPAWHRLTPAAQKLHARNCYQVLGLSLDTASRFLICWTPDGCESSRTRSVRTGGTATAIALAERHGVPVFNLARPGRESALAAKLQELAIPAPKGARQEFLAM